MTRWINRTRVHLRRTAAALPMMMDRMDDHPDRMRYVLSGLLGVAAAEIVHRHHGNRPAAAKYIENILAEALDDAGGNDKPNV